MNENNQEFYRNIGIELHEIAVKAGFDAFFDMQVAWPFIKDAGSILELGAGYGRCIEFLVKHGFPGEIVGVERASNFVDMLREKFAAASNVRIIESDIKQLQLDHGFEVALWMWSGFIEFSPAEQIHCLESIHALLSPGGRVLIDIPRMASGIGVGFSGTNFNEADPEASRMLKLDSEWGPITCFIPNEHDLQSYRARVGFSAMQLHHYDTPTGRPRELCIFVK